MGMFDQAARQAVKLDAVGFFRWLFAQPDPPLVFRDWLDTRRLPAPGAPDLTGDLVAEFDNRDEPGVRFALIVELQTEPVADIVERVSLYALQLRRELGRGPVGAAILNLTGSPEEAALNVPIPGAPGHGMFIKPIQRNLSDRDAAATLAEIAAGRTARCILPWIPLMHGDDVPAIIAEWTRLAALEPDAALRSTCAVLALVFAELTKGLVLWQKALENWNMRESQIILGWERAGEARGRLAKAREDLLLALELRFQRTVPDDLRVAIEGTNDLDMLSRWFRLIFTTGSLEDFRAAMT